MKSATSTIRYFAYGSQCNVEGVKKRGIHPISSVPAMLPGYKLHFKLMGMGIVEKEDGAETHGVLHELNDADWKRMCEIEVRCLPLLRALSLSNCKAEISSPLKVRSVRLQIRGIRRLQGGYAPSELEVFPYNGTPTTAYVFTVGDQMVLTEDSKPTDRYIHVIAKASLVGIPSLLTLRASSSFYATARGGTSSSFFCFAHSYQM